MSFFFDDHDPMECYMRGGICWPIRYEYLGNVDTNGYVVIAGQDIKTRKVYVFEQLEWVTIDNIVDEDNTLRYYGLSHWFNEAWTNYFATAYFWHQEEELARRFRLQVLRSDMILPKPRFIEIPTTTTSDIISCIWGAIKTNVLRREGSTPLEDQLREVKAGDKQVLPAVHALGCCLLGLERFQWRPPVEKPIKEILVPFR